MFVEESYSVVIRYCFEGLFYNFNDWNGCVKNCFAGHDFHTMPHATTALLDT